MTDRVQPVPYPFPAPGKVASSLGFDGGGLTIRQQGYGDEDGSGWFAFKDDDLGFDQDDGPMYRFINVPNSELIAMRDHLNRLFPPVSVRAVELERHIRDFITALDRGYLDCKDDSAFIDALRAAVSQ